MTLPNSSASSEFSPKGRLSAAPRRRSRVTAAAGVDAHHGLGAEGAHVAIPKEPDNSRRLRATTREAARNTPRP